MTEKSRRGCREMEWFVAQLNELSRGVPHSGDPILLNVAIEMQAGTLAEEQIAKYKAASIWYVNDRLHGAPVGQQDAFLQFVVHSELANESIGLRKALARVLRERLELPIDRLSQGLAAVLLRARQDVIANIVGELLRRLRTQHRANPSWGFVSVLATAVGRVSAQQYSLTELIDDLTLLADKHDFEESLRLRNAIWRGMQPASDSIELLTQVRSRQEGQRDIVPRVMQVIRNATEAVENAAYLPKVA